MSNSIVNKDCIESTKVMLLAYQQQTCSTEKIVNLLINQSFILFPITKTY